MALVHSKHAVRLWTCRAIARSPHRLLERPDSSWAVQVCPASGLPCDCSKAACDGHQPANGSHAGSNGSTAHEAPAREQLFPAELRQRQPQELRLPGICLWLRCGALLPGSSSSSSCSWTAGSWHLSAPPACNLVLLQPQILLPRPVTLQRLLELRQQHPEATLVAGHTEVGIARKYQQTTPSILLSVSHVPELQAVEVCTPRALSHPFARAVAAYRRPGESQARRMRSS